MSPVMGRLPHTFGHEWIGYSRGTLFVDHASGKIFNFCQYSTNADETVTNKHRLESYARQDGVTIEEYHADNGVFASKLSRRIVTCYINRIPLVVLKHTIKMVLLNGILKQSHNGLGQTCCILLITGQPKLKSASDHRQLNMLYGFSTECQILQMVCCQMSSGLLAAR
jgi:hypothetical protein